jgi:hypothetical protein
VSLTDPNLYRTALDLIAARQQAEYEMFEAVLGELVEEYHGYGVSGVFAVTNWSVTQASVMFQRPAPQLLGGLRIGEVPAAQAAVPDVLTLLYTGTEDLSAASAMARTLGATDHAEASMVVLADVSLAMAERISGFAGLPEPQVLAAWRQQAECALAAGTWVA